MPASPLSPLSPPDRVALLRADPEFAAAVPAAERAAAERLVVATTRQVDAGRWTPDLDDGNGGTAFALLVVSGKIVRETTVADRRSTVLLGAGDLLRPPSAAEGMVPNDVALSVLEPGTVAVLDGVFQLAARRWPGLMTVVNERVMCQAERIALHLAIAQLPRVEQRVIAMLLHLADRWGRITPDGVLVPVKLTHEALGRLIGAQRPTVSLALTALDDDGTVRRAPGGGWLLRRDAVDSLAGRPVTPRGARRPAALGGRVPVAA